MDRVVVRFFLAVIAVVIFLLSLSAWGTKEGELFLGILSLYSGTIFLMLGLHEKEPNIFGLRFRLIAGGIIGIIVGLITIFSYLT
jgi:hypothetical protein